MVGGEGNTDEVRDRQKGKDLREREKVKRARGIKILSDKKMAY